MRFGGLYHLPLLTMFLCSCGTHNAGIDQSSAVTSIPPATIAITPLQTDISLRQSRQLTATAYYPSGLQQSVTSVAQWTTSSSEIATVNGNGDLTCVSSGRARLSSSYSGITAVAYVNCNDDRIYAPQSEFSTTSGEFTGPFANWINVRDFGAVGDGIADDTASIQVAMNLAMQAASRGVLWVPSGKYRITSSLSVANSIGFAMIGEDAETTEIVWDGGPGGTMLTLAGSKGARFSRLAWNGAAKAETAHHYIWDGKTGNFPTGNAETDEMFVDVGYGLRVGWAGETMVDRSRFTRNTAAGISTEDWNALDVWVRDSTFEDCRVGLTNLNKAGHFHVYQSVFLHSLEADMEIANTSYFSERGNTSVGSAAFFIAKPMGANAAQITLQDNVIVNSLGTPVVIGNRGPLMMIDNILSASAGSTFPIVQLNDWVTTDVLTLGNLFDRSYVTNGSIGRAVSVDDRQFDPTSLDISAAKPAPFRVNAHRSVTEIAAGSDARTIQAALDQAATMSGQRPVVHLQSGYYNLDKSLTIVGGSDVQIVGDGAPYSTFLTWTGVAGKPMFQLHDPVRATIQDVGMDGGNTDVAIDIEVNDTPGSRLRFSNISTNSEDVHGFVSDGVDQAIVELLSSRISGSESGISVIGGQTSTSGIFDFGRVASIGGAAGSSSPSGVTFSVSSGGTLTVLDNWRDSGEGSPQFLQLHDASGHLTLDGGVFSTQTVSPFSVDSFRGDVSLIGYSFDGDLAIRGDNSTQTVVSLGVSGTSGCDYWVDDGTPANAVLSLSDCYQADTGWMPMQSAGETNADLIRQTFSRVRGVRALPHAAVAGGLTDFSAEDVYIKHANTAIHLHPSDATSARISGYAISDADGNEIAPVNSGGRWVVGLQRSFPQSTWQFHRNPDGTLALFSIQLNEPVDADLLLNASPAQAQSWIVQPDGTGLFTIQAAGTPFDLAVDSAGNLVLRKEANRSHWRIDALRN